jgi:histidyl-tRNA synthetase
MALLTQGPKGTQDLLPAETAKWQTVEEVMRSESEVHGIHEIRTPVFEHTELFLRSVGDTTDVVEKQMYTFEDKSGRSITLRPEGTAGVVRAMVQSGIYNEGYPQKYYYFNSCYRYEKPQAGRLREFHQFGTEIFGTYDPSADLDLILLAKGIFDRLGIQNLELQINSIGCRECRKQYYDKLREYFRSHIDELCETCRSRLDKNPMRILDCKEPECGRIAKDAPKITDYLCDDCRAHFDKLKEYLDMTGTKYTVNPKLVRGLDYYTRTVFEFVSDDLGAQSTVCGGGRYDGLVEELGGKATGALGFGMGIERLLLVMEAQKIEMDGPQQCEVFFVNIGEAALKKAISLCKELRECEIYADCDICGRNLKAQMKYADRIGAKYTLVLGDDEVNSGKAKIKNMKTGETHDISITGDFVSSYLDCTSEILGESEKNTDI